MILSPVKTSVQTECPSQPWAPRVSLHCCSAHTVRRPYPLPVQVKMDSYCAGPGLAEVFKAESTETVERYYMVLSHSLLTLVGWGCRGYPPCSLLYRACPTPWFQEWLIANRWYLTQRVSPDENSFPFLSSHQLWEKEGLAWVLSASGRLDYGVLKIDR